MQGKVMSFVRKYVVDNKIKGKILDVGSLDINGSIKPEFKDSEYIGLDMREGKNVDIVANAHKIPFPDNHFDCVTYLETIEHDNFPGSTLRECCRVLKKDGWFFLTGAGFMFGQHAAPEDYWRFSKEGFILLLKAIKEFKIIDCHEEGNETMAVARKMGG
ncbi:class I SAM-dependent methyltransferase, partial [bacterium]|nr:class I SAM-dependent methyltransferase [bacterium]